VCSEWLRTYINMSDEESEREPQPIDVRDILQENLRNANEKPIEFERTSSRRNRDYVILMIVGNLLLTGLLMLGSRNAVSVIFFVSGLTVFNVALAWVMLAVISDY